MPQEDFLLNLRFHDLRHEATCRLATKLPNLIELANVTGHREVTHVSALKAACCGAWWGMLCIFPRTKLPSPPRGAEHEFRWTRLAEIAGPSCKEMIR